MEMSAFIQLHTADDQLPADSAAKPCVRAVLDLLTRVIQGSRDAIGGLRPSNRSRQDLERTFLRIYEELAVRQEISQIAFRLIIGGAPRPLQPAAHDEICLIGREALINAARHSRASEIEVEFEYAAKSLRVLIRDDGCGIDIEVMSSGRHEHRGLQGMRERAQRIGAKLRVLSCVGGGTEVELSVPGQIAYEFQPDEGTPRWLSRLHHEKSRNEEAVCGSELAR